MAKLAGPYAAERRINATAEKIVALDSDLRRLSWTRVREIAAVLASDDLSDAERLECVRELDSVAATNLALITRLQALSAIEDAAGGHRATPDERAAEQVRIASASAAVLSQIGPDPEAVRRTASPEGEDAFEQVVWQAAEPDADRAADRRTRRAAWRGDEVLPDTESSAGLVRQASRKLDSLMDAVGDYGDEEELAALLEREGGISGAGHTAQPVDDEAGKGDVADGTRAGHAHRHLPWHRHRHTDDTSEVTDSDRAADAEGAKRSGSPVRSAASDATADDPNYDEKGRWKGDTAPVNVVQMLNAEMVYQSQDEDDKDRYAAAAAQASLYDDPVAVILPSTDELEGRIPTIDADAPEASDDQPVSPREPATSPEDEHARPDAAAIEESPEGKARARHGRRTGSFTERTAATEEPVVTQAPAAARPATPGTPGAPGPGGTAPDDPQPAEGEPSFSVGFSASSRTERAVRDERERKEAAKAEKRAERHHRFPKIFGHKAEEAEDALVIPRGKATVAPGDLFFTGPGAAERRRSRTAAEDAPATAADRTTEDGAASAEAEASTGRGAHGASRAKPAAHAASDGEGER